jgi:uncharacterized protein YhaN
MRLRELRLRAFGPFTDRRLDLSAGAEGLHVVYGLNEAGKSSALRALKALFYGVDERTEDDFLHEKAQLRIGGRFRAADGTEFVCYRRKGRKNTLLGPDEKPLPEDGLSRWLGGVDERLFETLFGIDHEALVRGGQALLEEHGREAEALFGAGLGSTTVHRVLSDLEEETRELFKPGGSKPLINARLSDLGDVQRRLRDASLSVRQWEEKRQEVEVARRDVAELDEAIAENGRKRATLERMRRTVPGLAKRRLLLDAIRELGQVPALPDDFGAQREQAVTARTLAGEVRLQAASRLGDLKAKMASLTVSEELLAEADAIDGLRERLGSHRKASGDRPGLEARRGEAEDAVRRILAKVRPGLWLQEVDSLRPLLARRRRANELGSRKEALENDVAKAGRVLAETDNKLAEKRRELEGMPGVPDTDGLRRAVEAARREGDLDAAIRDADRELAAHRDAAARDLVALGLWAGDLESLARAPFPAEATIQRFEARFREMDEERRHSEQARSEALGEGARTEEALQAMRLTGAIPCEDDLTAARARRDEGWQLLRRQWLRGEDVAAAAQAYGEGSPLPDAFEDSMAAADEVADRLRREASRVHERAAAQAGLEASEKKAAEAEGALRRIAEERQKTEEAWARAWAPCGLSPLSPAEMRVWLGRAERLLEKARRENELCARLERLGAARAGHRLRLSGALRALGDTVPDAAGEALAPVLSCAEARLASLDESARKRSALADIVSELEEEVRRLRTESGAATQALDAWRSSWDALLSELGLRRDATPGEVSDYLEDLFEAVSKADDAANLARRIAGIDEDARAFREDARGLLRRLAPDLPDEPVESAVVELHTRLTKQRRDKSRLEELKAQAERAEREMNEADAESQAADERLRDLCRIARCERPEELLAAEQRHQEYRQSVAELREVEDDLAQAGDGSSIETLEREAAAVDRDGLPGELEALEARMETELKPRHTELLERRLGAERDFEAWAGGEEASRLAQEAQQALSGLRSLAERYVRARLASRILHDEIERFRREHRDPILLRASAFFAKLTGGSFASVQTDFDEADQPVFVGVRPRGQRVRVSPGMSAGTRDQLYLALRLATLEHYLERSEPLPFIVDDILIQFDDKRTRATLEALADLSAKTQVILFTHHERVVEEARRIDGTAGEVFVHSLDAPSASRSG